MVKIPFLLGSMQKKLGTILENYNASEITIGTLGGHSGLDVCRGAKLQGFKTVAVCQKGRDKTYSQYYKTRDDKGIVDETIILNSFKEITKKNVQERLRELNTIFIHNRYFWVYCDYKDIERNFIVPIFGNRELVKFEERNIQNNQYVILEKSGIRIPKLFKKPEFIDRPVIVKVAEAKRSYERAFFFADSYKTYKEKAQELTGKKAITEDGLKKAVIEEYAIGAQVNFNFFYSPLTNELELMGTDTRRQTNLDGLLRLPATDQMEALKVIKPKMIETGHIAVTLKESLLEKAFELGEKFIVGVQKVHRQTMIGPFSLQGAVVTDEGKEDIVIFDVSMRIPGSPGTMFTPYSGYLYLHPLSYGERIAQEIRKAIDTNQLRKIIT